jgi:ferric-dicitrate binding protein FerR (iron transport regulator)
VAEDLDILLSRHFDDSASAEDIGELSRLVATDGAVARALLAAAADELALHDALRPAADGNAWKSEQKTSPEIPAVKTTVRADDGTSSTRWSDGWPRRLFVSRPWLSAAAAVLLAAGIFWVVAGRGGSRVDPGPVVTALPVAPQPILEPAGPGVLIDRSGVIRPATAGDALAANDRIRTPAGSGVTFRYPAEQTRVTVGPASTIAFANEAGKKRIELSQGFVDCEVEKQNKDRPLVIATPEARVRVVGTRFTVKTAGRLTRVVVLRGVVRVTRVSDGSTVEVSGGEYVDVAGTGTPAATAPSTAGLGRNMGDFWSDKVRPAGIDQ